jgi:hypothetical protein
MGIIVLIEYDAAELRSEFDASSAGHNTVRERSMRGAPQAPQRTNGRGKDAAWLVA